MNSLEQVSEHLRNKIIFSLKHNPNYLTSGKDKYINWKPNWSKLKENDIDSNDDALAILTGKVNNIIVFDFDGEEGMTLYSMCENLIQNTFIEDSTRGYKHVYFLYNSEKEFKSKLTYKNYNLDILSNGKCCVMSKNNNGNKIIHMPDEFKDFLRNLEERPKIIKNRKSKKNVTISDGISETTDSTIDSNSDFSEIEEKYPTMEEIYNNIEYSLNNIDKKIYHKLNDILEIMPESYFDNYKTWIECGMVIFNITEGKGFKLWNNFSNKKNESKYKKNSDYQMISLWNKFELKKTFGFGLFYKYIEKLNDDELNKQFEEFQYKYNLKINKSLDIYNYFNDDGFYLKHLKDELTCNNKIFESYNHLKLYLRDNLHKVISIVNDTIIIKFNIDEFFDIRNFDKAGLKLIRIFYNDDISGKVKKISLYDIILDNIGIFNTFSKFVCNFDYEYSDKDCFYMNRQFQAKKLEAYDLNVIQILLDFIKEIFCKNDEDVYNYFMRWLSFIVKYPNMKSNVATILYSKEQGCGKGTFTNFMCDYIFGKYNTIPNAQGLKSILGEQNYHLLGKKFINVNELSSVKEEFGSNFNNLKSLITEKEIEIKKLYANKFTGELCAEFIFCTNNKYSFKVEEKDRRYLLLELDGKYSYEKEFLINLNEIIRNENFANHFYTYLLTLLNNPKEFMHQKIPATQYKKDIIDSSQSPIVDYINFIKIDNIDYWKRKEEKENKIYTFEMKNEDDDDEDENENLFIEINDKNRFQSSKLYEHYVKWCEINKEKIQSNKWFSKNLVDNNVEKKKIKGINYFYF